MARLDGIEHRLAPRSDLEIEAILEVDGGRTTRGTIRNVSLTGVFVEMPRPDLAADHGVIRLTFVMPDTMGAEAAQWQGFIVRRDGRGIAAIFDSDVEEDWDGLAALLRSADPSFPGDKQFLYRCFEHLVGE